MKLTLLLLFGIMLVFESCSRQKSAGPPNENIYVMPIRAKIVSLDPHVTSDVYSSQAQSLSYESLYQTHFLKRPYTLIPALADGMPKVSADGKKWTFKIKKGIHYQDDPCFQASKGKGRELLASDFVYYFKRIANAKLGSPAYSDFEPLIAGLSEYKSGKSKEISGVRAPDPYTLEISILKKSPRFIYNFSGAQGAPLPEECVEYYGDKISEHAIGTGPYVVTQFSANRVVAIRNPNFREEYYPTEGQESDSKNGLLVDAGKRIPFIDKIELHVVEEDQPRWLRFLAGEFSVSGVPKDSIDLAFPGGELSPELRGKGIQHFRELMTDVTVHIFNMKDPVWGKHRELRQAFALTRDIPQYNKLIFAGFAIPAQSYVMPGTYSYDPNYKSPWTDRNLAKAKELLAATGFPDGKGLPPLVFPNGASTQLRQGIELLARQMKEVGIEVKYEPVSWPELVKRMKEGKFSVAYIGYSTSVPDPESGLPMFHSRSIPPNGQNYGHYINSEYDRVVEDIEVMENGPQRIAKIREAVKILERDLPVIPTSHRIMNQLYQPWIKNASAADELYSVPWIKYRRVEFRKQD